MPRQSLAPLSITLGLISISCAPSDDAVAFETRASAIINGTLDTTHGAVVAVISLDDPANPTIESQCSGTIIAVRGSAGFVLTAAHCVVDHALKPAYVVAGADYDTPDASRIHPVLGYGYDPDFRGVDSADLSHDFGMVTFGGADGLATMPPLTDAVGQVRAGDAVTFVGYGKTTLSGSDMNSRRYAIGGQVRSVDSAGQQMIYAQTTGGPCDGDSGGPAVSTFNGVEYVSAVTSYGDEDCSQFGVSGLVGPVFASFIVPYIESTAPPPSCGACAASAAAGPCAADSDACSSDPGCAAELACAESCDDGACVVQCTSTAPGSLANFRRVQSCLCAKACTSECQAMCSPDATTTPPASAPTPPPSAAHSAPQRASALRGQASSGVDLTPSAGSCSAGSRAPSSAWPVAPALGLAALSRRIRRTRRDPR